MTCTNCAYYYADVNDKGEPINRPTCHYSYDDNDAPCERDEHYEEVDE